MLQVHFWFPQDGNVGHSSLEMTFPEESHGTYISWWPEDLSWTKKSNGVAQSLADDIRSEGRKPDFTIHLDGLNERAARKWWLLFSISKSEYGLAGQNCSWAVIQALRVAGSDHYFPWYKIATKKNIPIEKMIYPMILALMRDALLGGHLFTAVSGISMLQSYAKKINPERVKVRVGRNPSLKSIAVAVGDEFSSVWSPHDALAYCLVLEQNMSRQRTGKALWQPTQSA